MAAVRDGLPGSASAPMLSPWGSPGRLSNQEEMLGLSQRRPEDQMCGCWGGGGAEATETKYKPADRGTSQVGAVEVVNGTGSQY